jgi:hypothetical protein
MVTPYTDYLRPRFWPRHQYNEMPTATNRYFGALEWHDLIEMVHNGFAGAVGAVIACAGSRFDTSSLTTFSSPITMV